MKKFTIDADIRKAQTLPAHFYRDPDNFERVKEAIFARSWNFAAESEVIAKPNSAYPFTLLENVLDEPIVVTKDRNGKTHCMSNVCTHRGKIVVEEPGDMRLLRCGYHGRCFGLDGQFRSMPEFEGVENFPTEMDHLHPISFKDLLGIIWVALDPLVDFDTIMKPVMDRVGWMALDTMKYDPEHSQDYYVDANWALYCDNYLEGFHIPFVHPALNEAVDGSQYEYELFPYCNLQLSIAKEGEPHFEVPEGAVDYGRKVYAYYFWVFPNLMFNFYPWGLSLNVVEPLAYNKTRVRFRTYFFEDSTAERKMNRIDQTELEDEAVVESVQLGLKSRFYQYGRFSPNMESAVHHFHKLVYDFMQTGN